MDHETAGDPVSGLKWTRRTTARIADQLGALGIDVCPRTVARLLKAMGYSLRVNHKKRAGASHPRRDEQFRHITELRERCAADNVPVISVDTKKKELVGTFRNPGAKWDRSPERVNDHDFRSDAEGLAIPYQPVVKVGERTWLGRCRARRLNSYGDGQETGRATRGAAVGDDGGFADERGASVL